MSDVTGEHDLTLLRVEHKERVTRRMTRMEFRGEVTEKRFRLIDQFQVTGFLVRGEELSRSLPGFLRNALTREELVIRLRNPDLRFRERGFTVMRKT